MLSQDQESGDTDDGESRDAHLLDDRHGLQESSSEEETELEELKECTFKPNINKSQIPARTVDDLIDWGKQRGYRILKTQIKKNTMDVGEFQPSLNPKSRQLAVKREGKIEERLLKIGVEKAQNLALKREQAL